MHIQIQGNVVSEAKDYRSGICIIFQKRKRCNQDRKVQEVLKVASSVSTFAKGY